MPNYSFFCKKCKTDFEEICLFSDLDANFPNIKCPNCNSKKLDKNVLGGRVASAIFSNPRESSKWDNWSYRQGKTMAEAKECRANAEAREKQKVPREYRKVIDDTNGGKRLDFID